MVVVASKNSTNIISIIANNIHVERHATVSVQRFPVRFCWGLWVGTEAWGVGDASSLSFTAYAVHVVGGGGGHT